MANFEPKTFNASDINGGQKFNAEDGITPEAINAPIESALIMQGLATTQPQYIENSGSPSVTIENGQFIFANLKGEKGEQGIQGVGIPSGGTAGQILTKTESGTAWEDAPSGGGGGGTSYLYLPCTSGYANYSLYFTLPDDLSNVDTIKIAYTVQNVYNSSSSVDEPEFKNKNITIYENGEGLNNVELNLAVDSYGEAIYYNVPLSWTSINTIELNFYSATNGGYGGKLTNILFEIKFK